MLTSYEFIVSIHKNGEMKLNVSGCLGAEYYDDINSLLTRLSEFDQLERGLGITLVFAENDTKSGYYLPGEDEKSYWLHVLSDFQTVGISFDHPNAVYDGGILSMPPFYGERDSDLVGFRPVAEGYIEETVPYELERGFDVTDTNSLYK